MKKNKKKFANCPVCRQDRHRTEVKTCQSILEQLDKAQYKHYKELGIDSYEGLVDADFEWACDECLRFKKAILASPAAQEHAFKKNLAYADESKICRNCNVDFVFSKEEKRKWYESYKFNPEAEPVNCKKCRKAVRELKAENKFLSDLLKKEEQSISLAELQLVLDIYQKWDKPEKVNYYKSLIKKRSKK